MSFRPYIKCEFCGNIVESMILGSAHTPLQSSGFQNVCGCEESLKNWEKQHREDIERRKRAKRGI